VHRQGEVYRSPARSETLPQVGVATESGVEGGRLPRNQCIQRRSGLFLFAQGDVPHKLERLKARCGHYRLRDFRTCDGQKLLADIARQDVTLLRSTLHHLRSLLSGIFKHAIQHGYLNGPNPMREVGTPGAPEGEETYAYALEEVTRMLLYLPQPAYSIAAVAAFSGLRRSELAGLLWENYDGVQLMVTRSCWEGHIDEPKTRRSKAPVPVVAPLAKILDAYREQCGNPTSGVMFARR
jgi:integrase